MIHPDSIMVKNRPEREHLSLCVKVAGEWTKDRFELCAPHVYHKYNVSYKLLRLH